MPQDHLGGEEWRDLDIAGAPYDPSPSEPTLKSARENIRSHRMGPLKVRLVRRDGSPVTGKRIQLQQTTHAFPFGDNLWTLDAMVRDGEEETGKARAWKSAFKNLFNAANNLCYWTERPRNDGSKTEDEQGVQRVENFARTVDWTLAEGMIAKGHPLFWSIQKCVPEWVKRYDYATRMKFAEVRVRNLVARFKGKVTLWDAVNEPMWEPAFKNLDQREWPHIEPIADIAEYIREVMRWCREEDPAACFLINDYGMEQDKQGGHLTGNDGSVVTAASQRHRFRELLNYLLERGSGPDAVGLQSHTGLVSNHQQQWVIYDHFAETGLPVHITEFWANLDAIAETGRFSTAELDAMHAEYVCNYLTCAFGHPAVEAFFFWGLMDKGVIWHGNRSGHTFHPTYERVRQLIHETWMTTETLTTDGEGVIELPAFFGKYTGSLMDGDSVVTGTWIDHRKGFQGLHEWRVGGIHP